MQVKKMVDEITIDNILSTKFEDLRKYCYDMVNVHVDYVSMDEAKFVYLLGYYPAIYNYFSGLFTFMINQVRNQMEVGDKFRTSRYRDKRDMLEQVLKSIKFQYDSLSRKVTLLTPNSGRGDESF